MLIDHAQSHHGGGKPRDSARARQYSTVKIEKMISSHSFTLASRLDKAPQGGGEPFLEAQPIDQTERTGGVLL